MAENPLKNKSRQALFLLGHQVNTLFCLIAAKRKERETENKVEEGGRTRRMSEKGDYRLWESCGYKPLYQI